MSPPPIIVTGQVVVVRLSGGKQPGLRQVDEPKLLNLARRGGGECRRLDEQHVPRQFEPGEPGATERDQLVFAGGRVRREHDPCAADLPPAIVGQTDDIRLADGGVRVQDRFHFFWRDQLAAGLVEFSLARPVSSR